MNYELMMDTIHVLTNFYRYLTQRMENEHILLDSEELQLLQDQIEYIPKLIEDLHNEHLFGGDTVDFTMEDE